MTITPSISVGQTTQAVQGSTHLAIQTAVHHIAAQGGGVVHVGPGVYTFTDAVYVPNHVTIQGSGEQTIFTQLKSVESTLAEDSNWYDQHLVVKSTEGINVGDGIMLRGKCPHSKRPLCLRFTVMDIEGRKLILDKRLMESIWHEGEFNVVTLHSFFRASEFQNLTFRDFVIDGNASENQTLNGNYGAGIFLEHGKEVLIENVCLKNYDGDGYSWQNVQDLTIRHSQSQVVNGLCLHPGSGSHRSIMQNLTLRGGSVGIFFCWGVKHGVAENNDIQGSDVGISIGYCDSDNLIQNNQITKCKTTGIFFRSSYPEKNRAPHRNQLLNNKLLNNGPKEAPLAVDIVGPVDETAFKNNQLKETRNTKKSIAFRIDQRVGPITFEQNKLQGFAIEFDDRRTVDPISS